MSNLFGTIRDMSSTLLEDINNDPECQCWRFPLPRTYSQSAMMYRDAASEDYVTMLAAMQTRTECKRTKDYHEWIALYMHGMSLTEEERDYRQTLAKRINEDG